MYPRFFFNMPSFSDGFCGLGVSPYGFKVPPASPGMYYRLSPTIERKTSVGPVCLFVCFLACLFLREEKSTFPVTFVTWNHLVLTYHSWISGLCLSPWQAGKWEWAFNFPQHGFSSHKAPVSKLWIRYHTGSWNCMLSGEKNWPQQKVSTCAQIKTWFKIKHEIEVSGRTCPHRVTWFHCSLVLYAENTLHCAYLMLCSPEEPGNT